MIHYKNSNKNRFVAKFKGNDFYMTNYYNPNFQTIFLLDVYLETCVIDFNRKANPPFYRDCLEHILKGKLLELSPEIDPDYFWELKK